MLGTFVLAAAATAVLALGAQDVRLLRLGLVAALWAALLGAFAVARMRREISSGADRADELRTIYQRELEREVAARREYTLTVEREIREQAEQREIVGLRAELAALRASLEHLLGRDALMERVALPAEPARLVPLPAYPRNFDVSGSRVAATGAAAKATRSLTVAGSPVRAAQGSSGLVSQDLPGPRGERCGADRTPASGGSVLPISEWSVNGRSDAFPAPGEDPESHFGPGRSHHLTGSNGVSNAGVMNADVMNAGVMNAQCNSRHGASHQELSGSNGNGFYHNGSHTNGSHTNGSHTNGSHTNGSHTNGSHTNVGGARWVPEQAPAVGTQRSVNDLLAAYGEGSVPRRRRGRDNS
jgi:hypothetical protein